MALTQKNVLRFLERKGKSAVLNIRFEIDGQNGCVYAPSQILRVLKPLQRKGLVRRFYVMEDDEYVWSITPQGLRELERKGERID